MAYLGKTPSQAVRSRYYFTATGGETSLSGTDDNSNTLTFTDGNYVDVALNGVTLVAGTDYNTTTANTIGGLTALVASDVVEVIVYDTFSVFSGNVNGDFTVGGTLTAANITNTGNLTFGDNDKAIFGDGSDLQIYHDGSNSYIIDNGTGDLVINTNGNAISLNPNGGGEYGLRVINNGAVNLYHDNSLKLATTAAGVDVTGAISSNKGSAGTLATFTDGVNSNFVVETSSLLTTIGNGGGSAALAFKANNTEAMRIDSSGNLLVGKTASNTTVDGIELNNNDVIIATRNSGQPLILNRRTNDGTIAEFRKDNTTVGAIGTFSGNPYFAGSGCGLRPRSGDISPTNASGSTNDAGVDLGTTSNRFNNLYLSGGVYLGGTGSANKLDDYEEGTWTPQIWKGSTQVTSPTTATGQYRKIGDVIFYSFYFFKSSGSNTDTNLWNLIGLPFAMETAALSGYSSLTAGYTGINSVNYFDQAGSHRWQNNGSSRFDLYGPQQTTQWTSGHIEFAGYGFVYQA